MPEEGLAERATENVPAAFTVSVNKVVLVSPSPVLVTVMVYVPVGVVPEVVMVRVELLVGFTDEGENEAVAPEGRPEAERETDRVVPETRVAVTVLVTELP